MRPDDTVNVLLVDDRGITRDRLASALDGLKVALVHVADVPQALVRLKASVFSLVLLQTDAQANSSLPLVAALRAGTATRHLPIVFIGSDTAALRGWVSQDPGVADFITEPLDPALVRSKVRLFCDIERRRLELAERSRRMDEELELATRVQRGFLPRSLPVDDRILFGCHYANCSTLGGDLYDVFGLGRGRIGLYMADVSGHGINAALLSGLVKMSFESVKEHIDSSRPPVSELLDPGIMLTQTNAALHDGLPIDSFITLLYAVIDPRQHLLRLSSAGHLFPLHYRSSLREASYLHFPAGPALGPFREAYFPVATVELYANDKVVFFTDGLIEAMDAEGLEFGRDRLLQTVQERGALAPDVLVGEIVAEMDRHRAGAPLSDDCSVVVVQVK
jgi:phosphoserine phosphatase RsbU/P